MFIVLNFGYDSRKEERKHRKRKDSLAGQNTPKVGESFISVRPLKLPKIRYYLRKIKVSIVERAFILPT